MLKWAHPGCITSKVEFDDASTMVSAHAVYASARDWARFGLLYPRDGVVDGWRILPEG
jgi:CubicO group peptidase (beta-lactamase class C family)